jgi:hypothetical protein
MVYCLRDCNSTEHFQLWQMPRGEGTAATVLSTVHMAQCIVDDVAKGMDIWYCVAEILFSHALEETDSVSSFQDLSGLASIPAGDERETRTCRA